ncbi:HesB/YadR/YfhF family protein [Ammoniphilus sp. 3BR4]|uniref:HesB/YadR/YfhF family protein n=1 Tax=Ammoniphilus sp. 3BR4 TaxID=3158265 RepID=UPI0034665E70
MKITITDKAMTWFREEMDVKPGDYIRFFARYGGCSTVQSGFSLGVSRDMPNHLGKKHEQAGITFYIEESDLWYFGENDLNVDCSSEDELTFTYKTEE